MKTLSLLFSLLLGAAILVIFIQPWDALESMLGATGTRAPAKPPASPESTATVETAPPKPPEPPAPLPEASPPEAPKAAEPADPKSHMLAAEKARTTARLSKQQIEQDIVRQGAPHSEARRRTYLIFGAAGAITSDQPGHCAAPVAGRDVRHRGRTAIIQLRLGGACLRPRHRRLEMVWKQGEGVAQAFHDLILSEVAGESEVRALKSRAHKPRAGEIRAVEQSVAQIGVGEIGAVEPGIGQIGAGKVGA